MEPRGCNQWQSVAIEAAGGAMPPVWPSRLLVILPRVCSQPEIPVVRMICSTVWSKDEVWGITTSSGRPVGEAYR